MLLPIFLFLVEGNGVTRLSSMYLKYSQKWAHCWNIACFSSTSLTDAEDYCMATPECNGFSFTHDADIGGGCYKMNCWPDSANGYGSSSHDYYEKFCLGLPTAEPLSYMLRLGPNPQGGSYVVHNHGDMSDSGEYTIGMWVYVTSDYDGEEIFTLSRWWSFGQCLDGDDALGTTDGSASPPRDQWTWITEVFTATDQVFEFSLYIGWPQLNENGYMYITGVSVRGPDGTEYIGNGDFNEGNDILEEYGSYGTYSIMEIEGNGEIPVLPTEFPTQTPTIFTNLYDKFVLKFPHCTNMDCFSSSLAAAGSFCLASSDCDGFSFTHAAETGNGCYMKNCEQDVNIDVNIGSVTHDYYEKKIPTESPTQTPTMIPTEFPTQTPTMIPTELPTQTPAPTPTIFINFYVKYVQKWPHCSNIACFSSSLADAEAFCLTSSECDGISFTHDAETGTGCYKKNCQPDDVNGYGSVTHDYHEKKVFYIKYVQKWPHCTNIACFSSSMADAEAFCLASSECDGFSFTHDAETGSGCYKNNCHPDDVNGYGSVTHDYHEKKVFYKKYVQKWPHCTNIACFSTSLADAVAFCLASSDCDGFSFAHDSETGSGCYKNNCQPDAVNGYGSGTHDYYEKL